MMPLRSLLLAAVLIPAGAMSGVAGDDKFKGQIDVLSHGWVVQDGSNGAPAKGDGAYALTSTQHPARSGAAPTSAGNLYNPYVTVDYIENVAPHGAKPGAGLTSLNSLRSSDALFANSRGGDQGNQGPSGTGKTLSASLLGKTDDGSAANSPIGLGASDDGQSAGKPMPTGTVTFFVDGVQQSPGNGGNLAGLPPDGSAAPDGRKYKMLVAPLVIDASPRGLTGLGANPTTQAMGDGSVRFISNGIAVSPGAKPSSFTNDPRATGLAPKSATFAAPTGTQAYNEGGVSGFTRKVIGPTK